MKFLVVTALIMPIFAIAHISEGMKPTLPLSHVEDERYLSFENFRTNPRAPIAAGIKVNGKYVRSVEEIFAVFSETVGATLPSGKQIIEKKDDQGRLIWKYPIGTRVIHELRFRDDKKTSFELRMVEKMEKRWAYGVYEKRGDKLVLRQNQRHLDETYELRREDGSPLKVELRHVPLMACQNCHSSTTSAPYQYETPQDVGPCEFTPANPKVKIDWVKNYQREFGIDPILEQHR